MQFIYPTLSPLYFTKLKKSRCKNLNKHTKNHFFSSDIIIPIILRIPKPISDSFSPLPCSWKLSTDASGVMLALMRCCAGDPMLWSWMLSMSLLRLSAGLRPCTRGEMTERMVEGVRVAVSPSWPLNTSASRSPASWGRIEITRRMFIGIKMMEY